ncbi:hypothetical protein LCY76_20770 [Fictibacillus sp. KIGAM418]|uniref:Uncharacterized protein n=1 Tax=Fictibacillus marinisediminis TaxID=2878389 RepID=A0A9X1XDW9_9BACL|nr:hypothetical protein [Fictibacillus marinisediminis]MCK6259009.1 hypothetical protein [Fictibacillus marinisediminis]
MGDRVRDEVYNTLSNASYQPKMEKRLKIPLKDGEQVWKVIAKDKYIQHDDYTGFDATIYKKETKTKHGQEELIIAYRGTEPNRWYGNGRLRGKQMGIRRIMEQTNSWRSGQSQKVFQMELQDYFGKYTRKFNEMETISDNIKKAKHATENSLTLLLVSRGPKG